MSDDEDDYCDAPSSPLGSIITLASISNRKKLGQSYLTVYHSAEGFADDMEMPESQKESLMMEGGDSRDKVSDQLIKSKPVVLYSQWKNRAWRRFKDGERIVDFVLAYAPDETPVKRLKRETFEKNLEEEGLMLEREENQLKLHFVKIHAPREVLCRYCEIMKMKMPIKKISGQEYILDPEDFVDVVKTRLASLLNFCKLDSKLFPERKHELTSEFSRDKNYLFDVDDPDFFNQSVRISVVGFILERKRFNNDHDAVFDLGVQRLISLGIYKAAYPLHDGDHNEEGTERNLLFTQWAQVTKWINFQPIDTIKDYFGVKFALYFTWLGFYTHMLIPASIMGIICFLYGVVTLPFNTLSNDICNERLNITMCPQCDSNCDYWKLQETCVQAKITYLFDNNFTIVFAIFMSFWATLYLELWKRYSANIAHRWGLTGFDLQAEHPRPQYLAKLTNAKKRKLNVVTHVIEPTVPFWRMRLPFTLLSFSVVLFLIVLALGAVFGVVLYRMSQLTSNSFFGQSDDMPYKSVLMPCSAAFINLFLITVLNLIYDRIAVYLTEMELLRTQTEFDDSLTLKIYLFQFVNYYSSIFYIAFLKGKFVGYPAKYNRIYGFRQEECSPGGCFLELFIQLAIIMIGKQALTSVLEMVIPFLTKSFNTFMVKTGLTKDIDDDSIICCNQWTEDYKLIEWGPRGLFDEYLEMILQYGFVTIFVSAFPLAPFFALLNNIFEMRLDAKKFLKYYRRPVPSRVKNIGVWYSIMDILGRVSVVTNAFMIAFSSNFIPRIVYMLTIANGSDEGFLEHSLAHFSTTDFEFGNSPRNSTLSNVTICRYPEYRNPPWYEPAAKRYKRPEIYWHILAARLAFIVVFQNVVSFVMMVVQWAIPDVSRKLRDQIKREAFLTSEIIIRHEALKSKESDFRPSANSNFGNYEAILLDTLVEELGSSIKLANDGEVPIVKFRQQALERGVPSPGDICSEHDEHGSFCTHCAEKHGEDDAHQGMNNIEIKDEVRKRTGNNVDESTL